MQLFPGGPVITRKTEDLIDALVLDLRPCSAACLDRRLVFGAGLAGLAATFCVVVWLAARPDLAQAVESATFWSKAAYTSVLAASGAWLLMRLGRPGQSAVAPALALAVVLLIAGLTATGELIRTPPQERLQVLMGGSASVCPGYIFGLAGIGAMALIAPARRYAPTRPRLAGAAFGLMAGGIAGTAYGVHCPEWSAAFVVAWYSLGIALASLVGWLAGRRLFWGLGFPKG